MVLIVLGIVCLVISLFGHMLSQPNLRTWKQPVWPQAMFIIGMMFVGWWLFVSLIP